MTVQSPVPERLNLAVEALDVFVRYFREWLVWAAPFFVVMGVLSYFMYQDMIQMVATIGAHKKNHDPNGTAVLEMMWPMLKWLACLMPISVVQHYAYFVFFTQREVKIGNAELNVRRFFYYLLYLLVFGFIMFGIELVCGALVGLSVVALPKGIGILFAVLFAIALIGVFFFVLVRLIPISVFAVAKVAPVIELGWRLTKGSFWRLFGNGLLLAIAFLLVMAVFSLITVLTSVALGIATHETGGVHVNPVIGAVKSAVQMTLQAALFISFSCTATRILIDERRQSDPSFLSNAGR